MAKISFSSLWFVLFFYVLFLFLFTHCYSFEGRETAETTHRLHDHLTHTIQLSSLLPSIVCNSSSKADGRKSSLKVIHKHGPCFQLNQNEVKSPSHVEILRRDQSRVDSIHFRFSKNSRVGGDIKETDAAADIPAKHGSVIGSANYIVTVGLGTPKKELSLMFDTGSDFTWTQCEPCVKSCYKQKEPIFDPRVSRTYRNISCSSDLCRSVESATGYSPDCKSSTCVYGLQYGDSSFSAGFFGKETLTLTPTDVFPNFLFGCGQNNQGLFVGAAGLIGLGRDKLSLVSQTAGKYKKFFSYCLPSSPSTTGHLTFGKGGRVSKSVKFTPLITNSRESSFYGLDVTGISVGGKKLSIPASVFSSPGTIIDSGTVITRLQPTAYSALRSAFQKLMSKYPKAPALSILDTCYDFSNYKTVTVPKISFSFNGGADVSIDNGIFYGSSASRVCLAFAPNDNDNELAIFGNVQQKTLEVVYDVAGGKIGFGPEGCK